MIIKWMGGESETNYKYTRKARFWEDRAYEDYFKNDNWRELYIRRHYL